MKIESIRLQSFKRFRQPLVLEDLAPGLNLFTAPNEGGKSTVVEAIRAAFLERHRTGTLDHLLPWDDGGASPKVEIAFTIGGQRCSVSKTFLAKKSCRLVVGGAEASGEEAENKLGELLGFSYAKRGASGPEHQGIPGLLWARQASSFRIEDEVRHASDYLRRALGEAIGELAASQGDRVLQKVAEERNKLLTEAGGRPRDAYAQAIAQEEALAREVRQLQADLAAWEARVDEFSRLRQEHEGEEAAPPWLRLRAQLQQVEDKLRDLERLRGELRSAHDQAEACASPLALLRQQLQQLQQDETALAQRQRQLAEAIEQDGEAQALVRRCEERQRQAAAADSAAREASERARRAQARATHQAALQDLARRDKALQDRLQEVAAKGVELQQLREQAARLALPAAGLKQLQQLQQDLQALQVRLEAVATRIEFELVEGAAVTLDGEPLSGRASRTLLQPATLEVAGVGRLRVLPGATELNRLLAERERQQEALQALLLRLGVASLAEAQERHRQASECERLASQLAAVLQALAPQGPEALREEAAQLRGSREREQAALERLPAPEGEVLPVAQAEAAEQRTRSELRAADESLQSARQQAAAAQSRRASAQAEVEQAERRLRDPARAERLAQLQAQLLELGAREQQARARAAAIAAQLQAANEPLLEQDRQRLTASADQLEAAHRRRHERLLQLGAELEAKGAHGLAEALAHKQRELAQWQRRRADLQQRAEALDHLLKLLRTHRAEVARRLRAPLQKHLQHYLQILFPGATVEIEDDLTPGRITRAGAQGNESGRFAELSLGTREQIGIIARLAYADLLKESGKPTHLILDDALVNSDAERLGQMKRVLFDAARRHQILVFTCHPQHWQDLGVAPRPLG